MSNPSTFDPTTTGQIIDGTALAANIRSSIATQIKELSEKTQGYFQPHLVILQAGARPDSSVYVRMKAKAAAECGMKFTHVQLDAEATVEDIVQRVKHLNSDSSVSGILVQLPLGEHVGAEGERTVTEAISPEKDVDG